jgi:hypothetical protein
MEMSKENIFLASNVQAQFSIRGWFGDIGVSIPRTRAGGACNA